MRKNRQNKKTYKNLSVSCYVRRSLRSVLYVLVEFLVAGGSLSIEMQINIKFIFFNYPTIYRMEPIVGSHLLMAVY